MLTESAASGDVDAAFFSTRKQARKADLPTYCAKRIVVRSMTNGRNLNARNCHQRPALIVLRIS
jgi:hypothetical protein